jgi:hypothetical protein
MFLPETFLSVFLSHVPRLFSNYSGVQEARHVHSIDPRLVKSRRDRSHQRHQRTTHSFVQVKERLNSLSYIRKRLVLNVNKLSHFEWCIPCDPVRNRNVHTKSGHFQEKVNISKNWNRILLSLARRNTLTYVYNWIDNDNVI